MKTHVKSFIALVMAAAFVFALGCGKKADAEPVDIQDTNIDDFLASLHADASPTPASTPSVSATPVPMSEHVAPDNTIDPNELDGTEEVEETAKLSYDEYKALNDDVVGWIDISNTNIDYPVVKSQDNIDYLTQDATKSASKAGAIFMDYRCSANGMHSIIYGHNMSKSRIMFAQLTNYSNRSFYDANRTFSLSFGGSDHTYKVFAVYSVDKDDAKYMPVDENFGDAETFARYMNEVLAPLSIFPVDTVIAASDHVVTLSTCSHTDYSNGRFVVHAVRVD